MEYKAAGIIWSVKTDGSYLGLTHLENMSVLQQLHHLLIRATTLPELPSSNLKELANRKNEIPGHQIECSFFVIIFAEYQDLIGG